MVNEYKVAVASSDGIVVNQHFGRAAVFYIYRIKRNEALTELLEKREVTPVCQGGEHDSNKLQENIDKLRDCQYVLVWRIGNVARQMLESSGLEVYEIQGMIPESLSKLDAYLQVQELCRL